MLSNKLFVRAILLYLTSIALVFLGLTFLGVIKVFPNQETLVQWDAGWYLSIAEQGYLYKVSEQSNTGFFPFFPFLWKLFFQDAVLISLFNLILFFTGVFFVVKTLQYKISLWVLLLSFSLPSLFFMYVPYSESLFFVFSGLYLYGNHTNNTKLKIMVLFLASLSRPTIFLLLPAIIFSEIIYQKNYKNAVKQILLSITPMIAGTLLSFFIVGYNSSNIWAYPESQVNNWQHSFNLPSLPFTTWRGYRILWLDAFALFVVLSSFFLSIYKAFLFLVKKMKDKDRNLLVSIGYLAMILVYITFFHPKEETTGQTSLLSINRYVFCTPFFFYVFYRLYSSQNKGGKTKLFLLLAGVLTLILLGFPFSSITGLNLQYSIAFLVGVLFFIAFQLVPAFYHKKWIYVLLYLVNISLQVYLFQSFLKGNWIG